MTKRQRARRREKRWIARTASPFSKMPHVQHDYYGTRMLIAEMNRVQRMSPEERAAWDAEVAADDKLTSTDTDTLWQP